MDSKSKSFLKSLVAARTPNEALHVFNALKGISEQEMQDLSVTIDREYGRVSKEIEAHERELRRKRYRSIDEPWEL